MNSLVFFSNRTRNKYQEVHMNLVSWARGLWTCDTLVSALM